MSFSLYDVIQKYLAPGSDVQDDENHGNNQMEYLSLFQLDRGVPDFSKKKKKKKVKRLSFPQQKVVLLAKRYRQIDSPSREDLDLVLEKPEKRSRASTLSRIVARYALEKPSFGSPLVIGSPLYVALAWVLTLTGL